MRKLTVVLVCGGLLLLALARAQGGHRATEATTDTTVIYSHPVPGAPTPTTPAAVEDTTPLATVPTTTVPVSPAQLANTDSLEAAQPLIRRLPHDAPHFRVDYRLAQDRTLTLRVTLKAVLNRPEQRARYEADLAAYKAEAMAWLGTVLADPSRVATEWEPPAAAAL